MLQAVLPLALRTSKGKKISQPAVGHCACGPHVRQLHAWGKTQHTTTALCLSSSFFPNRPPPTNSFSSLQLHGDLAGPHLRYKAKSLSHTIHKFRVFVEGACPRRAMDTPQNKDWDNVTQPFMGNADAVSAIDALEKEIAAVDRRFGSGELNSFGTSEEVVLQRFQELRRRQVELSRKQVELLSSKKTKGRFGTGQQGLDLLTAEMQKLCTMIEEVERMTLGGVGGNGDQEETVVRAEGEVKLTDGLLSESDDD